MTTLYDYFNEQQWELLKQRANRVKKAVTSEDKSDLLDVLVVSLGSEQYAINVPIIQAVYENIAVHALPSTPSHITGIANVRGHITTVLDISAILDTSHEIEGQAVLVLLALPSAYVALQVERVKEVRQISLSELSNVQNNHEAYIKGVMSDGTIFLDIQAIVHDPSLEVNES